MIPVRVLGSSVFAAGLLLFAGPTFAQSVPMPVHGPASATSPSGAAAGPGVVVRASSDADASARVTLPPGREAATGTIATTSRAFTYQGLLRASGTPLNGLCDLSFTVWNAASGGSALSGTQTLQANVSDGLFTVTLNDAGQFPDSAFDGRAVWVEIAVRNPSGIGSFTTLAPRQPITAAPVASTLAPHARIRAGDANSGNPLLTIEAQPDVYGSPEGLRVEAAPSRRWFSFFPTAIFADTDAGVSVLGVTRAGYGVFGAAIDSTAYAGYFRGNVRVEGKLQVDRFRSWIAINSVGPLPLTSATFTTSGGTLRLQYSGSGYSVTPNTLIGMTVKVNGTPIDQTGIFANNGGMHLAFVSKEWVLEGLAPGTHTVTLEPMLGTFTDSGDIFNVTITEMPY